MNNLFRHAWLAAICLLAVSLPLSASGAVIKKIELKHVGPPAVSEALIKANIRIKEGDTYNRLAVDEDVRSLYATGYFYNIRVAEEDAAGGVILTYALQGRPIITAVKFTGNTKFDSTKLMNKIRSAPVKPDGKPGSEIGTLFGGPKTETHLGQPLNEQKLFGDTQVIKEIYQKAGYQKTEIKYVLNIDENAGRGTVTFEITEAPKIRVTDIIFDGAQAFPQKKLRKLLKTRKAWIFSFLDSRGKLKDDQLDDDKEKLNDFYRNEGYIDFELKELKYEHVTPNRVKLHFIITEGRQYKVGAVQIKGASLFPTNDLLKTLKMKVGETFTPKGLSKDVEALQDHYGLRGYIDARCLARKNPNTDTGTMDLTYELTEGEKSYIEKIEIKGNVKTKDKVIRRELAVSPGEVYDMVRVKRSKERLEQMGYFERVDARPEETDVPNRKNLVVGVDEKNTGNFSIGAGFSSVDSLVGFAEMSQGNFDLFNPPTFTGGGQKFRIRASLGTELQDYQISFVEPWFLDRKLSLGVDLYHRDLNYLSTLFNERRTGMKLSLTRALGHENLIGNVGYTIESVGILNVSPNAPEAIAVQQGTKLVSKVGMSLAYDTRNSGLLPTGGQRTELSGEVAGGPLGGDANFYKLELKSAWYFPGFFEGHVLELVGRIGVVEPFGDRTINATNAASRNEVPLFDRWFLGGAYSLRGFKYRDVGPRQLNADGLGTEPIGGNSYYFASAEYSLPIIERIRIAAFYDMGNVYALPYNFDFASYNANYGVGLRLNLPIGPMRLDYGIPLRDVYRSQTGGGQFNLTVGYTREF